MKRRGDKITEVCKRAVLLLSDVRRLAKQVRHLICAAACATNKNQVRRPTRKAGCSCRLVATTHIITHTHTGQRAASYLRRPTAESPPFLSKVGHELFFWRQRQLQRSKVGPLWPNDGRLNENNTSHGVQGLRLQAGQGRRRRRRSPFSFAFFHVLVFDGILVFL